MKPIGAEVDGGGAARYERGTEEFARFCNFSDAVFAIAMTLLVLQVAIPIGTDQAQLRDKVAELRPQMISFAISFVVIGYYWIAHHRLVSHLRSLNGTFLWLNVIYLGIVAFFPFPTSLMGEFASEPLSLVLYASTAAVLSGMEVVLVLIAHRGGLMRKHWPPEILRYNVIASTVPVVVFLASIAVAYLTSSNLFGGLTWLLSIPGEALVDRVFKPDDAAEYA